MPVTPLCWNDRLHVSLLEVGYGIAPKLQSPSGQHQDDLPAVPAHHPSTGATDALIGCGVLEQRGFRVKLSGPSVGQCTDLHRLVSADTAGLGTVLRPGQLQTLSTDSVSNCLHG